MYLWNRKYQNEETTVLHYVQLKASVFFPPATKMYLEECDQNRAILKNKQLEKMLYTEITVIFDEFQHNRNGKIWIFVTKFWSQFLCSESASRFSNYLVLICVPGRLGSTTAGSTIAWRKRLLGYRGSSPVIIALCSLHSWRLVGRVRWAISGSNLSIRRLGRGCGSLNATCPHRCTRGTSSTSSRIWRHSSWWAPRHHPASRRLKRTHQLTCSTQAVNRCCFHRPKQLTNCIYWWVHNEFKQKLQIKRESQEYRMDLRLQELASDTIHSLSCCKACNKKECYTSSQTMESIGFIRVFTRQHSCSK